MQRRQLQVEHKLKLNRKTQAAPKRQVQATYFMTEHLVES